MLKSNMGEIVIEGTEATVRAEFATLCRNLKAVLASRYGEEEAIKKIKSDIEDAFLPEEELTLKALEAIGEMTSKMGSKNLASLLAKTLREATKNG